MHYRRIVHQIVLINYGHIAGLIDHCPVLEGVIVLTPMFLSDIVKQTSTYLYSLMVGIHSDDLDSEYNNNGDQG